MTGIDLSMITARGASCRMCPLLVESRACILEGQGSDDPLVVFVLDQPTRDDERGGVPALGKEGGLLRSLASEVGLVPAVTYYTSAVRCRPPKDRIPTDEELQACSGWLAEEIAYRAPLAVVLLGRQAARAYALIKDELDPGIRAFHLDDPGKALRDKKKRPALRVALEGVAAYVRGEEVAEPVQVDPWQEGQPDYSSPWLAVDTEGDSLEEDRAEHVVCYQLSDGERSELVWPHAWHLPGHVFAHNIKYDAPILGLDLEDYSRWDDTALLAYVLRETPVGLKKVGPRLTGLEMQSIKPLLTRKIPLLGKKGQPLMSKGEPRYKNEPRTYSEALAEEPETTKQYALLDAVVTARLAANLWPRLQAEPKLWAYYHEIEKPIVPIVASMESAGVLVDPGVLGPLGSDLEQLVDEYEEIAKLAMEVDEDFNINSTAMLAAQLGKLGVRLRKETAGGAKSVDKGTLLGALEILTMEDLDDLEIGHDQAAAAIAAILRYRQHVKLKTTYVDRLMEQRDSEGRVHGSFNQTVTDTNRFSSSDPNLQNIPNRSTIGKKIRQAFIAKPGYKLVRADFSNLELRIYAHYTDDDTLRQVFTSGGDAHSANAIRMFGTDKGEYRKRAKNGIFARVYGASDDKFLATVGLSGRAGKDFLDKLATEMPGLISWPSWIDQQLMTQGYVETLFGWRNYYDHYWSPVPGERAAALREAGNMPIQGTASGIVKKFMIQQFQLAKRYESQMVLQVHDETVVEVPDSAVDEFARATHDLGREMSQYLSVPLEVEIQVGQAWGDTKVVHYNKGERWQ